MPCEPMTMEEQLAAAKTKLKPVPVRKSTYKRPSQMSTRISGTKSFRNARTSVKKKNQVMFLAKQMSEALNKKRKPLKKRQNDSDESSDDDESDNDSN